MSIGIFIMVLMAIATYYLQEIVLMPLLIALAGLVVAGVGASQRWERQR
jgi:hypothetical protein